MDLKAIFAMIRYALKELMARRIPATLLFIFIAFAVLLVGVSLPQNYTATALIQAERKNIIEPLLLRGRAQVTEITPVSLVIETIRSERLLVHAALELGIISESSDDEAVGNAIRKLSRELYHQIRDDNVVRLFYTASSAEESFTNLNAIISAFRKDANQQQRDESSEAYEFISTQVEKYKQQLSDAEKRLSDYKINNMDGTETEALDRILELRGEIENLELNIDENLAKASSLKTQIDVEGKIQQARNKLNTLQTQKRELESRLQGLQLAFQDDYPDVVSAKNQISIVSQEIAEVQAANPSLPAEVSGDEVSLFEELRSNLSNIELQTESMQRRKASLEKILERENSKADSLAVHQTELAELTRDYDKTKQIYEELLQRRENASISLTIDEAGQGMSYKFREMPSIPTSSEGPPPVIFVAAAPFLGIFTLLGLSFAYVFLDPRLRYGMVPKSKLPEGIDIIVNIPSYTPEPIAEKQSKTTWVLIAVVLLSAVLYGYLAYGFLALEWLSAK
ncbi:hypothetical protein [Sessilibacter sp. MAH2]